LSHSNTISSHYFELAVSDILVIEIILVIVSYYLVLVISIIFVIVLVSFFQIILVII